MKPSAAEGPLESSIANVHRSARLHYRSVESDDAEFFFELRRDPRVGLNSAAGWPRPFTRDMSREIAQFAQKCLLAVIIELEIDRVPDPDGHLSESSPAEKESSRTTVPPTAVSHVAPQPAGSRARLVPIGSLTLRAAFAQEISQTRTAEMAINLLPAYHGAGYGAEATRWTLDWAFDWAGLHYIRLACFGYNTRAIQAYEAVGFRRKGVEEEAIWLAGRYWDFITYGLLHKEWKEIKEKKSG